MHLHDYETTFIFSPDLDEAEQQRLIDRLSAAVTDNGGDIMLFEDWGRRRLAYNIKKNSHGHYLFFNYLATASVPAEFERIIKIEDDVVRFLTIVNDRFVDPDDTRVVARARQRKRLSRTQSNNQSDMGPDSRGRGRSPKESMVAPVPVSAPTGSAVLEAAAPEAEAEAADDAAADEAVAEDAPADEAVAEDAPADDAPADGADQS